MNSREARDRLTEAGLLTERQAEAYVLREFAGYSREDAAEWMDISPNTLDSRLSTARRKVEAAEATVEAIDAIHGFEPDALGGGEGCDECGAALQSFVPVDGGRMCPSCAGVE